MITAPVAVAAAPDIEIPQLISSVDANAETQVEPEAPIIKYLVSEADTFWSIAQEYNVSPEAIAVENGLSLEIPLEANRSIRIPTAINIDVGPQLVATSAVSQEENVTAREQDLAADEVLQLEQDKLLKSVQELKSQPEKVKALSESGKAPQITAGETAVVSSPKTELLGMGGAVDPWGAAEGSTPKTLVASNSILMGGSRLPEPPQLKNLNSTPVTSLNNTALSRSIDIPAPAPQEEALVRPTDETGRQEFVVLVPEPETSATITDADLTTEAAVEQLKTDIARMREDNQQQPVTIARAVTAVESNTAAEPDTPSVVVNFESSQSGEGTETSLPNTPFELSSASLGDARSYNTLLNLSVGAAVSPSLPPLAAPDKYLPGADVFNGYIWPAQGTFTSGYGPRWGRMHRGIDIAAPTGTPIYAAAAGEVIYSGWNNGGFGNLVKIRHGDGSVTLYAHNSSILVRQGQQVKQGQHIAAMGSTGFSTGPHLHFEIHPKGSGAQNPMAFLPKR